MGLLATTALASRPGDDPPLASRDLAAFPPSWLVQQFPRLHVGVRTGFCGALTTYSGWNQAVVERAAAGGWTRALLGLLLGTELFVGSLVVGQHAAAALGAAADRREAIKEAAEEKAEVAEEVAGAGDSESGSRGSGERWSAAEEGGGPDGRSAGAGAGEGSPAPSLPPASGAGRVGETLAPSPAAFAAPKALLCFPPAPMLTTECTTLLQAKISAAPSSAPADVRRR